MKNESKETPWYKDWYMIVVYCFIGLIIILVLFSNNSAENSPSSEQTSEEENNYFENTPDSSTFTINEDQFNKLAIQSLYNHGFCYGGMPGGCGEADYPFIRVYNAEDFLEQGKLLLVTQISDDLYKEFSGLYNEEIVYVFRNQNQQSVDRIYVKNNKWSR